MALNAFKDGLTILNQDNLNALLALQPFQLIYTGTQRSAKTGSGVTENNLANYSFCTRFTLTGSTEIGRVELEVDRDGDGADLILQIRSGMNPAAGNDGTLLKQIVVPKEFIPTTKAYWSIPVGLAGLTSGGQYWLVLLRGGDSTNHLDWVGEASQDSSYPAYYRAGDSGAWTANNALHFRVYSGASGGLRHSIYAGTGYTTLIRDVSGKLERICRYLPPADGPEGGIRDVVTFTRANGRIQRGDM
jgi:hypothetical protein